MGHGNAKFSKIKKNSYAQTPTFSLSLRKHAGVSFFQIIQTFVYIKQTIFFLLYNSLPCKVETV